MAVQLVARGKPIREQVSTAEWSARVELAFERGDGRVTVTRTASSELSFVTTARSPYRP